MNDTKKLDDILNEIEQVNNYYKEKVNEDARLASSKAPYLTESTVPKTAQIGDFWYCTDKRELFICNGVVNGITKWSSVNVD